MNDITRQFFIILIIIITLLFLSYFFMSKADLTFKQMIYSLLAYSFAYPIGVFIYHFIKELLRG